MKSGVVLAAVAVIGFMVFELYAATRNGYRMEPAFVFAEFVEARRGVQRCGLPKDAAPAQFEHNFAWARHRAGVGQAQSSEMSVQAGAEAWLQARERELAAAVDARVAELGCSDPAVRKYVLRYRNLARLNLPSVPASTAGG